MAFAYRNPDIDRKIMIRLEKPLPPAVRRHRMLLLVGAVPYELDAIRLDETLLLVENEHCTFEDALLRATLREPTGIVIVDAEDAADATERHTEFLTFHANFFHRFLDFAKDTDIYYQRGHYAKIGSLAIFTHVYNDNTLLKVWEKYYSGIVPAKDLYVIDHGSASNPRDVLSPEVSVVTVPRGPVDQRLIMHFCSTFQRFLLSQYRWTIHVDADEILVHAKGWDYLKENLRNRNDEVIIKAARGFDLVQDIGREPALDLSEPISLQRRRMAPARLYAKPVPSSMPTTWRIGFHRVLEERAVVEDADLWLIHLSYVDIGLHLEKSQKWGKMDVLEKEWLRNPDVYSRPAVTVEQAERSFARMLETGPAIAVPEWMRGTF